jgi:hypothetical protein
MTLLRVLWYMLYSVYCMYVVGVRLRYRLEVVGLLASVKDLESLFSSLDTRKSHGTKGRSCHC